MRHEGRDLRDIEFFQTDAQRYQYRFGSLARRHFYEGRLVGQLNPKTTTVAELGLYMSGAKRDDMGGDQA